MVCARTARGACGAILTCPDRVSRYGARRRRTQQAGAAPYGLVAALLKANTKRVWYSKYLGFPLKRKRHSLQTHTHMELLARPPGGGSGHGDADGGGTRGGDTRGRGGAWAAERAVAAVLAAAGGGGWMRRLAAALLAAAMRGRRCCGGDAALSSRLTCARDSKHWQSAGAAGAFECARRAGRLLDGHSRESG